MRKFILYITLAVLSLSLTACSVIDDDRDGCASCRGRSFQCHVHVTTSIDSLIIPQVNVNGSEPLVNALRAYYNGIFNLPNRTVGISFYDSAQGGLLSSEERTMEGNEATFTIGIPEGAQFCEAVSPDNAGVDALTVNSNPQYSGRLAIEQGLTSYSINLYPVDAQVALVARIDSTVSTVQAFADSTVEHFSVKDSTYSTVAIHEVPLTLQPSASTAVYSTYTATLFPSVGQASAGAKGNTRADDSDGSWQITILATTASGSVTRTVLDIHEPLRPGDIRIFTVNIDGDGTARTSNYNVGATVTLNWKSGGEYNHDI